MDVTFDALMPPMGADGQGRDAADATSAQTRQSVGKGHLEQAGRWSGWIEVAGDRHRLGPRAAATATSRGDRAAGAGRRCGAGSPSTSTTHALRRDRIGTDAGDLHRGWVWREASTRRSRVEGDARRPTTASPTSRSSPPRQEGPHARARADLFRVDRVRPASGRDDDGERGPCPLDLRGSHRHGHQRVPPPARRRRAAGRADRVT